MKISDLHINQQVHHPKYGIGTVKQIFEHTVEVDFLNEGRLTISPETSGLEAMENTIRLDGTQIPLDQFIERVVLKTIDLLGISRPEEVVEELGNRWKGGELILQPADRSLQTKTVPLETFFHKIVMVRNNLRLLEQKINAHEKLSEAEKIEIQQYISRSYGSLTTFNLLFKNKESQFNSGS
ncbi:MAG: DUF3553 domain-containing protein [Methylacidiphilales bacterium]|nr:DUF3553 domain-containing protein [Candidatus Methylacidiphilales bacterium]MDW8349007.1 DUF3553 domain-containing protein [Verrucomicrobiae bacterium]